MQNSQEMITTFSFRKCLENKALKYLNNTLFNYFRMMNNLNENTKYENLIIITLIL